MRAEHKMDRIGVARATAALLAAGAFALGAALPASAATVEEYDLKLSLRIPRIYDNAQSLGSRKYQTQKLKGVLRVVHGADGGEPEVEVEGLENHTYRIGGSRVSYDVAVEGVLWHAVGSNRTGKFKTASVAFSIDADPSYNVGEDEPDNTLVLTLAGKGAHRSVGGFAAGQMGCGCRAYGHTSPTRIMGAGGCIGEVTDIASVWGRWRAKLKRTYTQADGD